jgi:hypothetical protein
MEISYSDIDLIEYVWGWLSPRQRLYRLAFPTLKVLRLKIRKKHGFRYVLINPRDPDHVIRTWYLARYPVEAAAQGAQRPLPGASRLV